MARRNLQPQQFFHGSDADLNEGDIIQSAHKAGRMNYPGLQPWRHKSVWATDSETDAWDWGHMGTRNQNWDKKVRPTVYEVEPMDPGATHPTIPEKRRHLGGGPSRGAEFTMGSARVKRRIDIPPPNSDLYMPQNREERMGQGTLRLEGPVENLPGSPAYGEDMARMVRNTAPEPTVDPGPEEARRRAMPRLFE